MEIGCRKEPSNFKVPFDFDAPSTDRISVMRTENHRDMLVFFAVIFKQKGRQCPGLSISDCRV